MGNKKYREIRKHGSNAFSCHSSVSIFVLSSRLGSRNRGSTQASALWTLVTPPGTVLCLTDRHGRPAPHTATSVSGGGYGDRSDPSRTLCDPHALFTGGSQGWGGPVTREVLGPGGPLLPGAAYVGGESHTRTGAGDLGQGIPGQSGTSLLITIIHLGQPILDQQASICLPGRASH